MSNVDKIISDAQASAHTYNWAPMDTAPEDVDILIGWIGMAAIGIGRRLGKIIYLRDRTDTSLCQYDPDEDEATVWCEMPSLPTQKETKNDH